MMAQPEFWDDCLVVEATVGSWANVDNSLGSFYGEFPGIFCFPACLETWNEIPIYACFMEIPANFSMRTCMPKHVAFQAYWEQRHWLGPLLCLKLLQQMLENEQLHWKKVAVGKASGRFIPRSPSILQKDKSLATTSSPMGRQVFNLANLAWTENVEQKGPGWSWLMANIMHHAQLMMYWTLANHAKKLTLVVWVICGDWFGPGHYAFSCYMSSCSKEHQNP